jgi:CMP-N,N'-diacetyllegionaminic acid synthase
LAAAPRLLILVPARGGSKGLPRKNVRLLGGRPLLAWTAAAIREAAIPDALAILSTDDDEIAAAGRAAGLEVPFRRPAALATDEAGAEAVARHALDWAREAHGAVPECLMLLQPTSPFRPAQAIQAADAMLRADARVPAVLGVKALHRSPATLFRLGTDQALAPLSQGETQGSRRQALEPLYTPNGAMYLIRSALLRDGASFFPAGARALVMDPMASLDIDDADDWRVAEAVAREMSGNRG